MWCWSRLTRILSQEVEAGTLYTGKRSQVTMKTILVVTFSLLLVACATNHPLPDLKRLYGDTPDLGSIHKDSTQDNFQNPVILLHGILGSRLRHTDTREEVWPGGVTDLLFNNFQDTALPIHPDSLIPAPSDLDAYAITDRAAGQDYYSQIIRTLHEAGGYNLATPGQRTDPAKRQYYVFVYDWRQDNVQSARKLDQLIEQIREDYGAPDLRVDLVAHSMGGLIARYYLRYGTVDVLDDNDFPVNNHGASRVRRVVLVGTPNFGSVSGLQEFLQGFRVGLRRIPTEVIATWPSAYQLLPHPINTWLVTVDGRELERDLFDVNIWRRFEWSVFDPEVEARILEPFKDPEQGLAYLNLLQRYFEKHLERARRFVWSLSVTAEEFPISYVVFGGDCILTPARIIVEEVNGESVVQLYPDAIVNRVPDIDYQTLMLEPGDGRVTKPSLLARQTLDPTIRRHRYSFFPLDYSVMFCDDHDQLTGNINFQDNLLNILLSSDKRTPGQ